MLSVAQKSSINHERIQKNEHIFRTNNEQE